MPIASYKHSTSVEMTADAMFSFMAFSSTGTVVSEYAQCLLSLILCVSSCRSDRVSGASRACQWH